MMIRNIFVSLAVFSAALLPSIVGAQTQAPPSAVAFYRQALERTRDHLQPSFATYQAKVDGLDCSVEEGNNVACHLKIGGAQGSTKEPIAVSYRASDERLAMQQQGRSFVLSDVAFMNATWQGVDELIRYGFIGKPTVKPAPSASLDPQSHLPVIAVVSSLSPDAYRIEDVGPQACGNGDPGHMVHLIALRDPLRYPVDDAVVNMRTGDLCMVRFAPHANAMIGLVGANGEAELDLGSDNGFVMVQDERIVVFLRAVGIAVKRLNFNIAFSNYAFPSDLSPVVFTTPEPHVPR